MNLRFSERTNVIKASEIRELLKLTEFPDIISFAGGLPAPELFPIEKLNVITAKVLKESGKQALQYGPTEGYTPLREIIAKQRLRPFGINAAVENLVITSGSQQALDFTAKLFIDKDDIIICESPSYLGAINAFKAYQPRFIEIPMDDDGMIVDDLEKVLEKHPETKFIYTIPDFQNPTGKTMSVERRKKLVDLGNRFQIPIIEDCPYSELVFEGDKYPSLKSMDENGIVIQLGTFSKTFCPGFRIGWICAEPELIQKYIIIKQGADLQSSSIDQRQVAAFMETYDLNEHISNIISVYRKRRDVMFSAIVKYLPEGVKFTNSKGGLFTWMELREDLDSAEILKEALKEKVAFVPGASFFANSQRRNFCRLNFSNMPEDRIIEGMRRLGEVLKKYYV